MSDSAVITEAVEVNDEQGQEQETERVDVSLTGESVQSEDNDSSDDFGNFSDASIEEENETLANASGSVKIDELKDMINKNFNEIFDSEIQQTDGIEGGDFNANHQIQELIASERPSVIYEQLVQLDTVLQPFVWSKSSIRAAVFHILRIEANDDLDNLGADQVPLNDVLFTKLMGSLNSKLPPTDKILRDYFKYKYVPRISHKSLLSASEQELYEKIPNLINTDVDLLESESAVSSLQEYHDLVCNAIDLLYLRYKVLNKREKDLSRDKAMFENVISNLTGHTQRLHRNEIANYNKQKKKQHRFSWIGR